MSNAKGKYWQVCIFLYFGTNTGWNQVEYHRATEEASWEAAKGTHTNSYLKKVLKIIFLSQFNVTKCWFGADNRGGRG